MRECETCGRESLRLKLVKPSGLLDEGEPRWLRRRDRFLRRILILWTWAVALTGAGGHPPEVTPLRSTRAVASAAKGGEN